MSVQVTSAHLVSSHSGEGIAAVTSKLCRERKGRDVFVVGAANVGKSAFVRAMLKEMSRCVVATQYGMTQDMGSGKTETQGVVCW